MASQFSSTQQQHAGRVTFVNLEELEELARSRLTDNAYGYYASGAESGASMRANREVFTQLRLLPRMMRDVSRIDTSIILLGQQLDTPILVAPMAMQCMAHPDGELAVVRACAAAGTSMGVSTMGTTSLEDVAAASGDPAKLMFQLYVLRDRDFTRELVQRAEQAGYGCLVVTVDAPRLGKRETDVKNRFVLPEGLRLANLAGLKHRLAVHSEHREVDGSGIAQVFASQMDASLTWDFVSWLKSVTRLPILVKGILAPQDALLAVQAGVHGIVLSNHGGRQCDCAPSAVEMLPHVVAALGTENRVPLIVDGGFRRGSDVLKALALGADAVLLGRPVLWGLALGGQSGVQQVLQALQAELELVMALTGCASLKDVTRDVVIAPEGLSATQLAPAKL